MPKKAASKNSDTDPNLAEASGKPPGDAQPNDDSKGAGSEMPLPEPGDASDKSDINALERTTLSSLDALPLDDVTDSGKDTIVGKTILGKYKVLALMGSGGMSRVYKAVQLLTQKTVALKLLHKHLSDKPTMMRRFQAEAQASHHLAHPHIITVYDFGITEDNQPFIAMDYLEGRALSEIVRTWGQLSIDRVLKITDQILDALEHAHESGVLHRDLKPSNIVLIPVGEDMDYVKLVDFGIAKILPKAGLEAQELTQSGDVFGSPLYMSPEQCLGNMTNARSDIYAVGCLLYECLTGKPPLVGNNTLETMHKQVNEMPSGLANLKADVRLVKQLEDIIFKAMAKEPENRFQYAQEMRRAIEQTRQEWREGSAVLAYMRRYGTKCERLLQNKLGKRWRSKVTVTAVMFAIALHYTVMMSTLYRPGSAPNVSERTIPWSVTNQPLYKIVAEEKRRRLRPITDSSDTEDMAEFASGVAETSSSGSGQFRSYLYNATENMWKGDFDTAYRLFIIAKQKAIEVGMEGSMDGAYLHMATATCLLELSQRNNSVTQLNQALQEIRAAALVFMASSQDRPAAFARCIEGNICVRLNRPLEAIHTFRASAIDCFNIISNRVTRQKEREHLRPDSRIDFRWAEVNEKSFGYELASIGAYYLDNNDGFHYLSHGQLIAAIPAQKAVVPGLPSQEKLYDYAFFRGKLEPRCEFENRNIKTYLIDAEDTYQLLAEMYEKRGSGKGSLTTAVARANLGLAQLKKGFALRDLAVDRLRYRNFDECRVLFDKAQTRFEQAANQLYLAKQALELHLGSTHKYVAFTLFNLSDAQMSLGKIIEALETRAEAQKINGAGD